MQLGSGFRVRVRVWQLFIFKDYPRLERKQAAYFVNSRPSRQGRPGFFEAKAREFCRGRGQSPRTLSLIRPNSVRTLREIGSNVDVNIRGGDGLVLALPIRVCRASARPSDCLSQHGSQQQSLHTACVWPLAAEPIGPGGPRPAHFLALVGSPYLWPAHFFG